MIIRRQYLNVLLAECSDPTQRVDFDFIEEECNRKTNACRWACWL